jgi:S-formylglutathione hydrolase FrmB
MRSAKQSAFAVLHECCNDYYRYCSVSTFAPICNPVESPWGLKALPRDLGNDKEKHKEYDATELVVSRPLTMVIAIVHAHTIDCNKCAHIA